MHPTGSTYEQLDLFSCPQEETAPSTAPRIIIPVILPSPPKAVTTAAPKKKTENPKPVLPDYLKATEKDYLPQQLEEFLRDHGFAGVATEGYDITYLSARADTLYVDTTCSLTGKRLLTLNPSSAHVSNEGEGYRYTHETTILSVAPDGVCWARTIAITMHEPFPRKSYHEGYNAYMIHVFELKASKWRQCTRLLFRYSQMQSNEEISNILLRTNPYAHDFAEENGFKPVALLLAPQLETLSKAGYAFADNFKGNYTTCRNAEGQIDSFNRLCQPGRSPKDIFKTPKSVFSVLKNEQNLEIWDTIRKMEKFGKVTADDIRQAYDSGMNTKELDQARSILSKEYAGKKIFTWTSLLAYLQRVDMFEAIPRQEALMLLSDYLQMCQTLEMKPRVDGDSLKREHDVTARTTRQKRDEIRAKKMNEACGEFSKYDYAEDIYSVRAIKNYDDLLDEACQQHNCVASYADRIAAKTSLIFVMRETAHPDKSLITIELSPTFTVRQKFLAYNRPIHNKSQSEFIERWLKKIRTEK